MSAAPDRSTVPRGAIATLAVFVLLAALLSRIVVGDLPELHTVVDTVMIVLSTMLALLYWDIGNRLDRPFAKHLSITFAAVSVLDLLHGMVSVEWSGPLAWAARISSDLRLLTWLPPAFVLPLGVGASLWLLRRGERTVAWFALGVAIMAGALLLLFQTVPPYGPPGFLGMTRPGLLLVPLLWAAIAWTCWKMRAHDRIVPALGLAAVAILISSAAMLYSLYPSDAMAIIARLGRVAAYIALFLSLMHLPLQDMLERSRAVEQLKRLNEQLDTRVREQSALLQATHDRLAAEIAERHKSHKLFEAITENTPAVIYVKDLDGRYLMINRRYCEIFCIDSADVVGKTDHDLFTKPEADAFRAMDERVVRADRPLTEQESAPHHDGVHSYVSVKAPLHDECGRPYAVFGISTDITDLKRARQALAESEARARLIVEAALDAVIGMDGAGTVVEWSPHATAIFGWTRDEALGRPLAELIIPERYRASHMNGLVRYLATGEVRALNRRMELQALHRDGYEFPVEVSIASIQAGGVVTFSGFARDITERKAAEAALQAQLEEILKLNAVLRQSNEELERFAYVCSHDMQEPVRMMNAYACLLQEMYAGVLDDKGKKYFGMMSDNARRMQKMIQDILTFSRVGREERKLEAVDSAVIAQEVLNEFEDTISEMGAIVTCAELPRLETAPTLLRVLLQNLVGNALKFHATARTPEVEIAARREGGVWRFAVRDNGIGIDPAFHEHVFTIFKRFHRQREYPGTGIGLSTCQKFVRLYGGDIGFDTVLGEGTTFYFTLPAPRVANPAGTTDLVCER
jgi:PAS domain S-box-containing protein